MLSAEEFGLCGLEGGALGSEVILEAEGRAKGLPAEKTTLPKPWTLDTRMLSCRQTHHFVLFFFISQLQLTFRMTLY